VKRCAFLTLAGSLALLVKGLTAQQSNVQQSTAVDVNGNALPYGPAISQTETPNGSQTLVTTQSVNGRTVPMEEVETRILKQTASEKVTERTVRRYDPQGNPLPPTRQVIEEHIKPDGSSTTDSTTYSTDINGNTAVTEKSVTDTQKTTSGETADTVVERPTVNGLETVEKQSMVLSKQPNGSQSETTTYRRNGNGEFFTAVRETNERTVQGSEVTDNSAEYERNAEGDLQLHGQTVTHTVTDPDGLKNSVVDIYSSNVPGVVSGSESGLKLIERDTIDNTPGPGGSVVQTFSAQRPTVSSPGTLGPATQISQTVCKGDCTPKKSDK
jgi:hypothetical protein